MPCVLTHRLNAIPISHSLNCWSTVGRMKLWLWAIAHWELHEMNPGTNKAHYCQT